MNKVKWWGLSVSQLTPEPVTEQTGAPRAPHLAQVSTFAATEAPLLPKLLNLSMLRTWTRHLVFSQEAAHLQDTNKNRAAAAVSNRCRAPGNGSA